MSTPSYQLAELTPVPNLEPLFEHLMGLPYRVRRTEIRKRLKYEPPRYLYKFRALERVQHADGRLGDVTDTSLDRLRTIVVDSKLRLSSPSSFNDPFDMTARVVAEGTRDECLQRFTEIVESQSPSNWGWRKRQGHIQQLMDAPVAELQRVAERSFRRHASEFGVYCFVGDRPHDVLMWSHYGRDHTGICLQFEWARDVHTLSRAVSIDYNDEYPVVGWIKNFREAIGPALMRKHTRWKYENEYRVSLDSQAGKFLDLRPDALTGIIIGCRTDAVVCSAIESLLAERAVRGHPAVQLYYARMSPTSYELNIWKTPGARV
jgi:Protein of unknown function (DUF2971)